MAFAVPEPFAWNATFDVGHAEINAQHVRLFEMINELAVDHTKLTPLLEYVLMHFKLEEGLFESHHYANAVEHKAIHDKFVSDAVAATKDGVITDGIIAFLKDWLVTHIMGSDMKYKGKI